MLPCYLAWDNTVHNVDVDTVDLHVQDLLDRKNYKQAIEVLKKAIKKKPSIRYEINIYLLQIASGEKKLLLDGLQKLEKRVMDYVSADGKPLNDYDILIAISRTLPVSYAEHSLLEQAWLSAMWEQAVMATPPHLMGKNDKGEELLEGWFRTEVMRSRWLEARKVAVYASRQISNKHFQQIRTISTSLLDHSFGNTRDLQQHQLATGLTRAFSKNSIKNVPELAEQLRTMLVNPKDIRLPAVVPEIAAAQTSDDVRLIFRVFQQTKDYKEAFNLLKDDSKVGLRSYLGCNAWWMVWERLKLGAYLEEWEDVWKLSYHLLCDAIRDEEDHGDGEGEPPHYNFGRKGDDLRIWSYCSEACLHLHDQDKLDKFEKLLVNVNFAKRSRLITQFDVAHGIAFDHEPGCPVSTKLDDLDAFKQYYELYLGSSFVFDDFRARLSRLEFHANEGFMQAVVDLTYDFKRPSNDQIGKLVITPRGSITPESLESQALIKRWMAAQISVLKFKYCIELTHPQYEERLELWELKRFAKDCLDLYSMSLEYDEVRTVTDQQMGDEAALLAVSAFERMHNHFKMPNAEYQAILILEKLLEVSRHNYMALLALIRLYVKNGVWSKAYEYYKRLDIKNIQIFSEAWIFTTRIASIFPYVGGKPNTELFDLLRKYTDYAESSLSEQWDYIKTCEQVGNFHAFWEAVHLLKTREFSFVKSMHRAELFRLMVRSKLKNVGEDIPHIFHTIKTLEPGENFSYASHALKETRSDIALPSYDHFYAEKPDWHYRSDPIPKEMWVRVEQWWFYLHFLALDSTKDEQKENLMSMESPYAHSERASAFSRSWRELDEHYDAMGSHSGLSATEALIAIAITGLITVEESDASIRLFLKYEGLVQSCVPFEIPADDAMRTHGGYWRQLVMSLTKVLGVMVKKSEEFKADPVAVFSRDRWELLHFYFKTSELFLILPSILVKKLKLIERPNGAHVKLAKRLGVTAGEEGFEFCDEAKLKEFFRLVMKQSEMFVKNFSQGARECIFHWQDGDNLAKLVATVRRQGIDDDDLGESFQRICKSGPSRNVCLELVKGWLDALKGIEVENIGKWRERWPLYALKHL